jgi:hypothetical protein
MSNAAALTVNAAAVAPAITTQPASATVTAPGTATFSVAASGTAPLAYQWRKNGVNIPGATGSSYTTPSTTTADSGSTFRVVVSNSAGSVMSNAAALTVNAAAVAPAITTPPASVTVTAPGTATFSVAASGTTPLTYQWQKNGANIPGATGSSYTTPSTTTADSGSTFRVVVSNSAGSVTSTAATLTVNVVATTSCTFTLSQTRSTYPAGGGTASVTVTAPNGCAWTSVSNVSWITIAAGKTGTGTGSVVYTVEANESRKARTGTLTVAGRTFTVKQRGR